MLDNIGIDIGKGKNIGKATAIDTWDIICKSISLDIINFVDDNFNILIMVNIDVKIAIEDNLKDTIENYCD